MASTNPNSRLKLNRFKTTDYFNKTSRVSAVISFLSVDKTSPVVICTSSTQQSLFLANSFIKSDKIDKNDFELVLLEKTNEKVESFTNLSQFVQSIRENEFLGNSFKNEFISSYYSKSSKDSKSTARIRILDYKYFNDLIAEFDKKNHKIIFFEKTPKEFNPTKIDRKTLKKCLLTLIRVEKAINKNDFDIKKTNKVKHSVMFLKTVTNFFISRMPKMTKNELSIKKSSILEKFRKETKISQNKVQILKECKKDIDFLFYNSICNKRKNSIEKLSAIKKVLDLLLISEMKNMKNCSNLVNESRLLTKKAFKIEFNAKNRVDLFMRIIIEASKIVPDGILVCVESFSHLYEMISTNLFEELSKEKLTFIEAISNTETVLALENYKKACDLGRGGIFFSSDKNKTFRRLEFVLHQSKLLVTFENKKSELDNDNDFNRFLMVDKETQILRIVFEEMENNVAESEMDSGIDLIKSLLIKAFN